ncbi:MAG: TRAP transporter small permease [Proteobacteria bacterium]|nr:TRAP transporter small permease [Pseudomonadota bacterium]
MQRAITTSLRFLCAGSLSALLLVVLLVIVDTKLELGAAWASELSRFLLGWTVMLGGALAYAELNHLGLDIVVNGFQPAARRGALVIGHVCVLCFAVGVLIYGGAQLVQGRAEMGQTMPALGISRAWFYLSMPVAGVLMGLAAVGHLGQKRD